MTHLLRPVGRKTLREIGFVTKRPAWLLVFLFGLLIGIGCGPSTNVQNPTAPSTPEVGIAFQPAPPSSLFINARAAVAAVVNNDSSNAGVDWALTCQGGSNCGLLAPLHTSSGENATYTPPSTLAANSQSITISAFATADHTKNVLASITVSAFASSLNGTYVVETNGVDTSGFPYQRAGVIALDGNGGITGGEQSVNYIDQNTGLFTSASDPITGGSYFVGPDGRGTLSISTADQNIGQQGVETFSLVVLSNSKALITKMDNPLLQGASNESSVGTMDLQTNKVRPKAGYAFVTRGMNASFAMMCLGGVLNIDSPGSISGIGSVTDMAIDDGSGLVTPSSSVSGTVSVLDPFGKFRIKLTTDFGTIQFAAYTVDSSHLRLIEIDNVEGSGLGGTTGIAIGQGSATGTFTSNNSFKGIYVFGLFGEDVTSLPTSLSSAGTFAADGNGNLSQAQIDEFQSGLFLQISDGFTGTYTVDPGGSGRVDTTSSIVFNNPNNGTGPELVFYLAGNGKPALVLDADIEPLLGGGGLADGYAYPAGSTVAFTGAYGLTLTQNLAGTQADATGQFTVDSSSKSLSGVVDTNLVFNPQPNTQLTGTFETALGNRLTATLSNPNFSTIAVAFYVIDAGHGVFVETDSSTTGNLTFGYFEARVPVCENCP